MFSYKIDRYWTLLKGTYEIYSPLSATYRSLIADIVTLKSIHSSAFSAHEPTNCQVVLVQGHYLSFLPLCSRNEPVFLATCTPVAMPETRECVVQGATNVFTTIHSMDMKFVHVDRK
ncbi:unnamed protein product [Nezara viridula]|uniref:Uncharacterized protein n=1 Tax=Nezara viridula TaxID=85310 RepID=A0A9P0E901_NEZVI|nr:unnamed protein product [Nezara viridula]